MNFVEELKWRGMLHDMMPVRKELWQRNKLLHISVSTLRQTLCISDTFAV